MKYRILIIEDDAVLADGMSSVLRNGGHSVHCLMDGIHAHDALAAEHYDLAILDLGLPRMHGLEVLRLLRAKHDTTPVMIVTASDAIAENVSGFKSVADDYLTKPFDLAEFEARVLSLARRQKVNRMENLEFGALTLNTTNRKATINAESFDLSPREYSILEALMASGGKVLSRADLNTQVSLGGELLTDNLFQVNISRLRKKIEGAGVNIRTIRGFGYLLQATTRR